MLKASIRFLNVTTNPPRRQDLGQCPQDHSTPVIWEKEFLSPIRASNTTSLSREENDPKGGQRQGSRSFPKGAFSKSSRIDLKQNQHFGNLPKKEIYPSGNPPDRVGTHERGSPFEKRKTRGFPSFEIGHTIKAKQERERRRARGLGITQTSFNSRLDRLVKTEYS